VGCGSTPSFSSIVTMRSSSGCPIEPLPGTQTRSTLDQACGVQPSLRPGIALPRTLCYARYLLSIQATVSEASSGRPPCPGGRPPPRQGPPLHSGPGSVISSIRPKNFCILRFCSHVVGSLTRRPAEAKNRTTLVRPNLDSSCAYDARTNSNWWRSL
jgi:hypothetical protein